MKPRDGAAVTRGRAPAPRVGVSGTAPLRPLRAVDASELESLLRQQRAVYERRFGAYIARGVSEVEQAVRERALDGFTIGEPHAQGYAFVIRDVEADALASLWVDSGCVSVARQLVERVTLDARRRERRLEAQDLGYGVDDQEEVLASFASVSRRRLYMRGATRENDGSGPNGVSFRNFGEGDLSAAATISASAFADSPDVEFAASYRSLSGCLSRLFLSIEGRSWGPWERSCSPVALASSGKMLGFALVTRIAPHVGHLVEIAVSPEAQGRGLGTSLLKQVLAQTHQNNFDELTLCVTAANSRAKGLYRSEGFQVAKDFHAHVLATGKTRSTPGQNLPSRLPGYSL